MMGESMLPPLSLENCAWVSTVGLKSFAPKPYTFDPVSIGQRGVHPPLMREPGPPPLWKKTGASMSILGFSSFVTMSLKSPDCNFWNALA